MRAVLQRVTEASVTIDGQVVGEIGKGIMVLFGMLGTDTDKTIDYMLDKVINLRIFEDENGKMNLSLMDIEGELLIVPNFTLYGDARKGRRPGYSGGAAPELASELFDKLCAKAQTLTDGGPSPQQEVHLPLQSTWDTEQTQKHKGFRIPDSFPQNDRN